MYLNASVIYLFGNEEEGEKNREERDEKKKGTRKGKEDKGTQSKAGKI